MPLLEAPPARRSPLLGVQQNEQVALFPPELSPTINPLGPKGAK